MKPKAILVPFGYPDYPKEVMKKFIVESKTMLSNLNIELSSTSQVTQQKEVEKVIRQICQTPHDFIIALLVSWVEAPNLVATLREFFSKPILLWSHTTYEENGTRITLGALPAAGVVKETLEQMGANFKFIYGMPDSPRIGEEIELFAHGAKTISSLSKSRVGLFGYFSMGMYTGGFDHLKLRSEIGPEMVHLDQYLIVKEAEKVDQSELRELIKKARSNWDMGEEVKESTLQAIMEEYLALKKLVTENNLDALTVKCQYELSREYGVAPCIPLSLIAEDIPTSCEGDVPLIISQLILYYLTGKVTTYGDVHDVLSDNSIIIAACGFAPFSLARPTRPIVKEHTALYKGLLNCSPYEEGKVTLCRLANSDQGYKMHIATGRAMDPPPFHEIGCPTYAGMKVVLDGSVENFMLNLMSQHYAIVYGDVKNELLVLTQLLRIKSVVS